MPANAPRLLLALLAAALAAPAFGQCSGFTMAPSSGASMTPGATDIGNHCDDCNTAIALPFPVNLYGVNYTTANASSNGTLQFTTNSSSFSNACLPQVATLGVALLPHWDDLRTDGAGEGIFTSVSGVAPNRVFNIEWRTHYFSGSGTANFEVRLFEDNSHAEMIYGTVTAGGSGATVGVQHNLYPATQFQCNAGGIFSGLKLNLACTNDPFPPVGTGAASPATVYACGQSQATLLTVNVTAGFNPPSTGTSVVANLTSIGGSAAQPFYNDGTHGDVTPNDAVHSFSTSVSPTTPTGNKSLIFTVADAQGRSSNGAIGLAVDPCPSRGPDVFVANLIDIANYGAVGNITAYAVGTDACNMGDLPVNWFASVNQHPVIAQNMYRLKDGRFEHLGQSWLKHGFSSTNSGTCGTCIQPPLGSTQLGVNCSDAYGSGLNGSQGNLGPRSQVNATTAEYPYPFSAPGFPATIGRRLQVYTADVDPAQNIGAQYYVECHYVTYDDARWSTDGAPATNGLNNASYRRIAIGSATAVPTFVGGTVQRTPAIFAWQAADPTVQIANADYAVMTPLSSGPIVGRFHVAAKVTNNGNGTWRYEYAVHNLNSDRCGGSFSVPKGPGVTISNIGFHGVFAHSGEPYPNTAANPANWIGTSTADAVTWACAPYLPPNGDNANAIRWGTMYNFRFDANIAPVSGAVSVGLFKPGTPTTASATALPVPGLPCVAPCCPVDFNGDGIVEPGDLDEFITAFFSDVEVERSECDFNGDGFIEPGDLDEFITAFFSGC